MYSILVARWINRPLFYCEGVRGTSGIEAAFFDGASEEERALLASVSEGAGERLENEYKLSLVREKDLHGRIREEAARYKALIQEKAEAREIEKAVERLGALDAALTRLQGHTRAVVLDLMALGGGDGAAKETAVETGQMEAVRALMEEPEPDRAMP